MDTLEAPHDREPEHEPGVTAVPAADAPVADTPAPAPSPGSSTRRRRAPRHEVAVVQAELHRPRRQLGRARTPEPRRR